MAAQPYYHPRLMSEQVCRAVVDSLEFARTAQTLRGSLPVAEFARLQDDLWDGSGLVEFVLHGGKDVRQRPSLRLQVEGELQLRCQRCLGPLRFHLKLDRTLLVVPAADEADEDSEEDCESIEPDPRLDVAGLVEDEVILSIPFSPRHPDGECRAESGSAARADFELALGKLAALKRSPH